MTVIKICGITRVEDGLSALQSGADWLGFIRWPKSRRYRPLRETSEVLAELRADAGKPFEAVGVYVNADLELILDEVRTLGLDRIQLHGNESEEYCEELRRVTRLPIIKAIKIEDNSLEFGIDEYPGADVLADSYDPVQHGGTGQGYDYGVLGELVKHRRVIVSGGLQAETVGEVINGLQPYGVDVSSGVEVSPGIKSAEKIFDFIHAVRSAEQLF